MWMRAVARKGGRGMHGRRIFFERAGSLSISVDSSVEEIAVRDGVFTSKASKRSSFVAWAGNDESLMPTRVKTFSSREVLLPQIFKMWCINVIWPEKGAFIINTVFCSSMPFERQSSRKVC